MNNLCKCGCGQKTSIAKRNRKDRGWIKGQPIPYVWGHNPTKTFLNHLMNFYRNTFGVTWLDSDCVLWKGCISTNGYGVVSRKMFGTLQAHRISYILAFGSVPKGKELDHLCRNRACVNPFHLEPVTRTVNVRRGAKCVVNEQLADEIRKSPESRRKIAKRLGISPSTVYAIRIGKTWKCLL